MQRPVAHNGTRHQPHCLLLHVTPSRAEFPAICPSTSAHTSLPALPTAWLPACPPRRWTGPKGCEHNRCRWAARRHRGLSGPRKLSSPSPSMESGQDPLGVSEKTSPQEGPNSRPPDHHSPEGRSQGPKQGREVCEGASTTLLGQVALCAPSHPLSPGSGPLSGSPDMSGEPAGRSTFQTQFPP